MRRIRRVLLAAGLLVGGLTFGASSADAGPFRRGWGPYGGFGRYRVYQPAWRYGGSGPYGNRYGWGGNRLRYPGYGSGYPGSYGTGYSGFGLRMGSYPAGMGWGYPGYYGGTYPGGMNVRSYPW